MDHTEISNKVQTGFNWQRTKSQRRLLWLGWQIFEFYNSREFLDQPNNYQLLKQYDVQWRW